jgi:hypothetical protein
MGLMVDDLATHLAGAGLGLAGGTNLFKGELPPSPDACVALIERGGLAPAETLCGVDYENAGLQVLVRGAATSGSTVRTLMNGVFKALLAIVGQSLGGTLYVGISAVQSPFQVEIDDNNRTVMGVNLTVRKTLS